VSLLYTFRHLPTLQAYFCFSHVFKRPTNISIFLGHNFKRYLQWTLSDTTPIFPTNCYKSRPCALTKHYTIKAYWGVEVELHAFLTSTLDGGECSASRPGRFTSREKLPGTNWIGGWVGPRTGLDAVVKRKISRCCRDSNPRSYSP
jgi:hypothetical protein